MNKEEMNINDAINALKESYEIRLEEYPIRTKGLKEGDFKKATKAMTDALKKLNNI